MEKRKTSKDYPSLFVRLPEPDLEEINDLVERILKQELRERSPDEKLPKRNAIISKALIRGLKQLIKK